jgi:predicted amidohydrolase
MKPSKVRIGIHQAEPGTGVTPEEQAAYREAGVGILVLPEYFWVRPGDASHQDAAAHFEEDLAEVARLSTLGDWVVVGGTVIEPRDGAWYNTCPVFRAGKELARYRKIHLMPGEARHGISPGERFVIVETLGLHLAPVICADVLYHDTFDQVASLRPDLILAPMSSPLRPVDPETEKDERDREIFLRGAAQARAPIVKAGGVGTLFGRPLQGRSLIATPLEILFRTPFPEEGERRNWIVDVPLVPPAS